MPQTNCSELRVDLNNTKRWSLKILLSRPLSSLSLSDIYSHLSFRHLFTSQVKVKLAYARVRAP